MGLEIIPSLLLKPPHFIEKVVQEAPAVHFWNHVMTVRNFTLPQLSDAQLPVREVAWRVNGCNCCNDYATPSQTHMVVHVYEERKKDPTHFQGWMPTGLLRQFDPTHPAAPTDVDHQWYNGPQTDLPQNSRATYMCFAGSKLNLVGISTEGNGRVAVKAAQCDLVHGVGKQLPPFLAPPHPDNVQATLWMLPETDTATRLDLYRIKALDSACRYDPTVIKFLLPPKLRTPSGRSLTITVWDSGKFVLLGRRNREEYKEIREPLNRYFANFLVPMGCMTRAEVGGSLAVCSCALVWLLTHFARVTHAVRARPTHSGLPLPQPGPRPGHV
jgi:hypothetical protein